MTENDPPSMRAVSRAEALALLGGVPYGRVVFTESALPAIRPVTHVLDDGDLIIPAHSGSAVLHAAGQVVAYEADSVSGSRLDWSVVVIGVARLDDNAAAITRRTRLPRPLVDLPMHHVLRIRPELVTGHVLAGAPVAGAISVTA
jgi:hypothetical protein